MSRGKDLQLPPWQMLNPSCASFEHVLQADEIHVVTMRLKIQPQSSHSPVMQVSQFRISNRVEIDNSDASDDDLALLAESEDGKKNSVVRTVRRRLNDDIFFWP